MSELTNKDIEFLSNQDLVRILRATLEEIDIVGTSGAHKSTTFLAVSAIEGLFGEILKLLRTQESDVNPDIWPTTKNGVAKKLKDFSLEDREAVLKDIDALPTDFINNYSIIRRYRNYIHTDAELRNQEPIAQSTAQLAIASLNALIEKYGPKRFASSQEWILRYGIAQVPRNTVIHMPQVPGDHVSLLVSELPPRISTQSNFVL